MKRIKEKSEIIADLQKRVESNILEKNNYDLLKKLIENAETLDEAIKIAELGTTYKRTGFHFDKRLERQSDTISYFKKNTELSFETTPNAITHKLIIGDNYPALLNLLIQYKGEIDVIYIDPPYGKDNMGEFANTNYDNAITRDNLLSMLYPRLYLAKQLLSDSGVIFCSIDDKNQAYVKGLFDEVFEEKNIINNFIWKKKTSGGQGANYVLDFHEYILCYSKKIDYLDEMLVDRTEEQKASFNLVDNYLETRGKYLLSPLKSWLDYRPTLIYKIQMPDNSFLETQWICGKLKYEELLKDGRIEFRKSENGWSVYKKQYINDKSNGVKPQSVIDIVQSMHGTRELKSIMGDEKLFKNPKPSELIKLLVSMCSKADSKILDFFAGSGTTGQAVLELNKEDGGKREFILVTNNEITDINPNGIAVDVTSKRLKRVMTGKCFDGTSNFEWVKKNKPLGDNLEVLEIAEVPDFEHIAGKTPFDVIDETLYGNKKFETVREKVEWVCDNFEITQKKLEEKE